MTPQTKMKIVPASKQEAAAAPSVSKIPIEISGQLRTLAHDLSNSIETIMQASYLLSQAKLDEVNKKWLALVDQAARDAAKINRDIREILRSQSQEEQL